MAEWWIDPAGVDPPDPGAGTGSEASPWATLSYAISNPAIADGDTIKVKDGTYVDDNLIVLSNNNVTITSASDDKTAASISNSVHRYWFDLQKGTTGTVIKDLTFTQSSTAGAHSVLFRGYIGGSGDYAEATFQDCNINSIEYAFQNFGAGTVIQRCHLNCVAGGDNNDKSAIVLAGVSGSLTIDSCLITNYYEYGIRGEENDLIVRNCTIISPSTTVDGSYGILTYGTGHQIFNTVVYSYQVGALEGYNYAIRFGTSASATNQGRMCIAAGTGTGTPPPYGNAYWLREGAPTVTEQLETQVDVYGALWNDKLFVDLAAGDYRPDPAGIAYQRGYNGSYPATDLDGNAFNDPPSIGCYEDAAAPGGAAVGAVTKTKAGILPNPLTLNPY
jgi:hypothetical protein